MNQSSELFFIFIMLLLSVLICISSLMLARYESRIGGDDFRFDAHRAMCAWWVFMAAASAATLSARWIGADTPMVKWAWLVQAYWLSLGTGVLLWTIFRWEARVAGHPFWPLDAWLFFRRRHRHKL